MKWQIFVFLLYVYNFVMWVLVLNLIILSVMSQPPIQVHPVGKENQR